MHFLKFFCFGCFVRDPAEDTWYYHWVAINLSATVSRSNSLTLSECIDRMAMFDNRSSNIFVLRWFLINFKQLKDRSECTEVNGLVHAMLGF